MTRQRSEQVAKTPIAASRPLMSLYLETTEESMERLLSIDTSRTPTS